MFNKELYCTIVTWIYSIHERNFIAKTEPNCRIIVNGVLVAARSVNGNLRNTGFYEGKKYCIITDFLFPF